MTSMTDIVGLSKMQLLFEMAVQYQVPLQEWSITLNGKFQTKIEIVV